MHFPLFSRPIAAAIPPTGIGGLPGIFNNSTGLCYNDDTSQVIVTGYDDPSGEFRSWSSSDNGGTWNLVGVSNDLVSELTYASHLNRYFAVSGGGTLVTSTDLITWTAVAGAPSTTSMAYSPTQNRLVVVSAGSGTRTSYTDNGTSFTTCSFVPSTPLNWDDTTFVTWDGNSNLFYLQKTRVASGNYLRLYTSADGITFDLRHTKTVASLVSDVAHMFYSSTLGMHVILADSSPTFTYRTSPDLVTWTDRDATLSAASRARLTRQFRNFAVIDGTATFFGVNGLETSGACYRLTDAGTVQTVARSPEMDSWLSSYILYLPGSRRVVRMGGGPAPDYYTVQTLTGF